MRWGTSLSVVLAGALFGILAASLSKLGNPPNMGVCVACFLRDIAGALGLHNAEKVQYMRPEIVGFVLGAYISAMLFGEFKPRGGSSPLLRFVLGMLLMFGALVFLGCPARMMLRLSAGDMTAVAALVGWIVGVYIGVQFFKAGFSLGAASKVYSLNAIVLHLFLVTILLLNLLIPNILRSSISGPGAMHTNWLISLCAGLLIGSLAQRGRLCFAGGFRDLILIGDAHLFWGVISFFISALIINIALGQFNFGISNQPVAHSAHIWNFAGMMLAGICAVLIGGCPLRQLVLAGEGNSDSALTVFGMLFGAALAHNLKLAATPDAQGIIGGPSIHGKVALLIAICAVILIASISREKTEQS
ncbi:MAG: YedE family putative selenium transporter [Armatimonadota bacterium]|nr:YedE family putative selenium transporter [Armatimonadota bacterium]MCX7778473.1 YedE family putative selenium transporter [Armatimonadota bacterium]MDW8026052.1 YedE family putative selenium transporter [Armatimonadota bacterium]